MASKCWRGVIFTVCLLFLHNAGGVPALSRSATSSSQNTNCVNGVCTTTLCTDGVCQTCTNGVCSNFTPSPNSTTSNTPGIPISSQRTNFNADNTLRNILIVICVVLAVIILAIIAVCCCFKKLVLKILSTDKKDKRVKKAREDNREREVDET